MLEPHITIFTFRRTVVAHVPSIENWSCSHASLPLALHRLLHGAISKWRVSVWRLDSVSQSIKNNRPSWFEVIASSFEGICLFPFFMQWSHGQVTVRAVSCFIVHLRVDAHATHHSGQHPIIFMHRLGSLLHLAISRRTIGFKPTDYWVHKARLTLPLHQFSLHFLQIFDDLLF